MKTLIIGITAFIAWSIFSTYFYVCKIRGFCNDTISEQTTPDEYLKSIENENISETLIRKEAQIFDNILIYFDFDKSDFKSTALNEESLKASEEFMKQNANATICITGFTDNIGTSEYNQKLGYRRAQTMQDYFESRGITSKKITIDSKGEQEPTDENNTIRGRANNRRTIITIKK